MVDLTYLTKFAKNNPVKMRRYISLCLEAAPSAFSAMQRDLKAEDWEQLRINAHSLKPQADLMGINSLKDGLIQIEDAVKKQQFDKIENLLKSSHVISLAAEEILKETLNQYPQ